MNRYVRFIKRHIVDEPSWIMRMNTNSGKLLSENKSIIVVFDTSIGTVNLGDEIIMDYCNNRLSEIFEKELLRVPTHSKPNSDLLKQASEYRIKLVCGTNLLYPKMESQSQWIFGSPFFAYNGLCLMGAGWNSYSNDAVSTSTKLFYKKYLSSDYIHSVRDNYTKEKLNSIGINNVLNTACPTMWKLNSKHCSTISHDKSNDVITTLTDYSKDFYADKYLLNVLLNNYEHIYLWLQGKGDEEYFNSLDIDNKNRITLIPRTLEAYDCILGSCKADYVGTRLHAGIRALNTYHRSIIIGVDNRAIEISKDTNLCVIKRSEIERCLESLINNSWKTEIVIPQENIDVWKSQFN